MIKRELTFLAIGVLMLITVILYTGVSIRFLARSLNNALNKKTAERQAVIRFEIEKAETLKK